MERVSVIINDPTSNLLFVAPHGFDDKYTDFITETLANELNGNAIINRGFRKSSFVDSLKDKGNCNSIKQLYSDEVIFEEFMEPLLNIYDQFTCNNEEKLNIFYIHGMGMGMTNEKFVIGVGLTKKFLEGKSQRLLTSSVSLCCSTYDLLNKISPTKFGLTTFAASSKDNLTQFFRENIFDMEVNSIQIEITADYRKDESDAIALGKLIASDFRVPKDNNSVKQFRELINQGHFPTI